MSKIDCIGGFSNFKTLLLTNNARIVVHIHSFNHFIHCSLSSKAWSSKAPCSFIKRFNFGLWKAWKPLVLKSFNWDEAWASLATYSKSDSQYWKSFCTCSQIFLCRMKAKFRISSVMILDWLHWGKHVRNVSRSKPIFALHINKAVLYSINYWTLRRPRFSRATSSSISGSVSQTTQTALYCILCSLFFILYGNFLTEIQWIMFHILQSLPG